MAITLELTDNDGTTINLVDTAGFNVLRQDWSPKIASRNQDRIAGICPYYDVEETISMSVTGVSTTNLLAKIESLISLMEKVYDWQQDDTLPAVSINYAPNGAENESSAVIVDLGVDWLTLPNEFEFGVGTNVFLQPVTIKIIRRGLWVTGNTTSAGSGTSAPTLQTRTWTGAESLESPIKMQISGFTGVHNAGSNVDCNGYLVWTLGNAPGSAGPHIYLIDSIDLTPSGWSANTSGINANAVGGSVYRATASSAATKTLTGSTIISGTGAPKKGRFNVLVRLKNNSASVTWTINYQISENPGSSGTYRSLQSKSIIVGTDTTDPQIVNMGSVYDDNLYEMTRFVFSATPSSAAGAGHVLDVDVFVVSEITQYGGCVYLDKINHTVETHNLVIDPRISDGVRARATRDVVQEPYGIYDTMPYRGDLWISSKGATQLNWLLLAVTEGTWRLYNGNLSSSPTVVSYDADLTIYRTTLVPT